MKVLKLVVIALAMAVTSTNACPYADAQKADARAAHKKLKQHSGNK